MCREIIRMCLDTLYRFYAHILCRYVSYSKEERLSMKLTLPPHTLQNYALLKGHNPHTSET